jgi:hypothetical protein
MLCDPPIVTGVGAGGGDVGLLAIKITSLCYLFPGYN